MAFPSVLKAERKLLNPKKFVLLDQVKLHYATLEDKEKELRDFVCNYEQVRLSNDDIKRVTMGT